MNALHRLNDQLLLAINHLARQTPWLHAPIQAYAKYGVVLFGLLLLAGVLLARRAPVRALAAAGWACVGVLLALALNQPIGHVFHEARPYVTHPGMLVLAQRTSDFSFPSDHAVMAGAAAAGLLLVSRRLGFLAVLAALVMALARVYIGAHYPWDVLGGLVVGAVVALVGWVLLRAPLIALTAWLRRQPGVRTVFAPPMQPLAGTRKVGA